MDSKVIEALKVIKDSCKANHANCRYCEDNDFKLFETCHARFSGMPADWTLSDLEKDGGE